MSLLEFARGPGFSIALVILLMGICWRLFGVFCMLRTRNRSVARDDATVRGGLRTIITRSVPPPEFEKKIRFQHYTGYGWHIGYFLVVIFSTQHILFFKNILGFTWPGLPTKIVLAIATVTLAILLALLIRRLIHPVLRLISDMDDYITWTITVLPLITGMLAYAHFALRYETLLALHILSVELLMIWFPFGKLMHAFFVLPSRFQIGATYSRKGVDA